AAPGFYHLVRRGCADLSQGITDGGPEQPVKGLLSDPEPHPVYAPPLQPPATGRVRPAVLHLRHSENGVFLPHPGPDGSAAQFSPGHYLESAQLQLLENMMAVVHILFA